MGHPARTYAPRRAVVAVLALGTLAATGLSLAACNKPQAAAPPPAQVAQVDVVTLHSGPVEMTTEQPGRLTAHRIAEMRPQVSGLFLKRLFVEGDTVRAGQQLYQIDPRPYEASLASAKATLAKARAAIVSARLTVKRYKPLVSAFAVSRQDLDSAEATLGQDQADVAGGEAGVQTAAINLAYTKMYAPIAGRTGRSSVTEGALVTQNQTESLVTITELDPIYLDVTEPSATVLRLKREYAAGQMKGGADGGAEVSLKLEDGSTYEHKGKLLFTEVNVDQSTGSVTLRAVFPNPDGMLLPGTFVREEISEGVRQHAILVPERGVTHDAQGRAVAMVVDKDGKIAQRILVTDRAIGADWLVSKGLSDGDHVVVSGLQQAKPGEKADMREVTVDGSALKPKSPT
jgi:membrane fusion protein (multidrug efflux system)